MQQRQLEQQRRELLQLQQQQQQLEAGRRRQVLQWQLELEQQYRQAQSRRSPPGALSPSSGLCTIYEAMETGEEEEEEQEERAEEDNLNAAEPPRLHPPQELDWNRRVDMVQQLINQTLLLAGGAGCVAPLLLLPVGGGGTLSPLEARLWPALLPQFSSAPSASVTSVSCYSPDGCCPGGDWTVVEVETQH